MDEGNLVPDDVVIRMVDLKIRENENTPGFIFDGFPRTVNQAKALDELLENMDHPISGMILLDVDEDELKKRIMLRAETSGRSDDQDEEKINNRIRVYREETLPVAEYYQGQGKLYKIKGVGSIEDIFRNLCETIDNLRG
jgi:adenylate kinase